MMGDGMGMGMGLMWIFGLLLLIGLILLIILGVRALSGGTSRDHKNHGNADVNHASPENSSGPQEILAERYARGELSTEQYHSQLRILNGDEH